MLFQGAEFGSSRPFLYFADFQGELGEAVEQGRREFLRQFPEQANGAAVPRPNDPRRLRGASSTGRKRRRTRKQWRCIAI
jgi:1,4-alpha-glucan branching enzyme